MEIKENIDNLTEEFKEYINLKSDSVKLQVVETLSKVTGDVLSIIAVSLFVFISLLFLLLAFMLFVAKYLGLVFASLATGLLLLVIGFIIYFLGKKWFASAFVAKYSGMLFQDEDAEDGTSGADSFDALRDVRDYNKAKLSQTKVRLGKSADVLFESLTMGRIAMAMFSGSMSLVSRVYILRRGYSFLRSLFNMGAKSRMYKK